MLINNEKKMLITNPFLKLYILENDEFLKMTAMRMHAIKMEP